jgi:DNA-binding NarL/FixJ family response regulator
MTSLPQNPEPTTKPLGLVWVECSNPAALLPLRLEEALSAEAHIHRGSKPPAGSTPSCIVFCSNGEENVASEARRLRTLAEGVPVLVFGSRAEPQLVREAVQAGARGYIHAEMRAERIALAVRMVSKGDIVFPLDGTLL